MNTSSRGKEFIYRNEGCPLTAYLDTGGVPTIGPGLTNHSKTVTRMIGKIVPGKTKLSRARLDEVFGAALAADYEPAVRKGMPGAAQHEFDAGADTVYNLGPKAMDWVWADLWRQGRKKEAGAYLASHYNTDNGKVLAGLTRRRQAAARLLLNADYGMATVTEGQARGAQPFAPAKPDPVVTEAQRILTSKGFNPGAIDGWMGDKTRAAIMAYQRAHPHLVADGILGPATLAQLRRDASAAREMVTEGLAGGGGGSLIAGATSWVAGLPWPWIVAAVVLGVVAWTLWRHRDVIMRRINTWAGVSVAV